MITKSKLRPQVADYAHLEPLPDPPREPDMQRFEHLRGAHQALKMHFANRDDVLVAGQGYLRHEATNDAEQLAPNFMVTFGVNPEGIISRNGYVISEVGKPPDFVLEVASRRTGWVDCTVKRRGYARYGVREYWRFDHTGGEFHDAALAGDVLSGDRYEPVPIHEDADGMKWGVSKVLGLHLCWIDGELRFRNPAKPKFLPTLLEVYEASKAAESRAATEAAGRIAAEARADSEAAARVAAEARAAELQAELERLREQQQG